MEPAYIAGIVVVVVIVVAGRIGLLALMRRAERTADRRRARKAVRTDVTTHHQARYQVGPHAVATHPAGFQLAASSWYALAAVEPLDVFGYADAGHSRAILSGSWGVDSRADLQTQVASLLVSGHRAGFDAERSEWLSLPPAEQRALRSAVHRDAAHSGTAAELERRLTWTLRDTRGARSIDFTAWDLVRVLMLCRAGVGAGYLSEAEGIDTGWIAAAGLRARYRDWADLHDHFVRGRWYWEGADETAEAASDERARQFLAVLTGPTGPLSAVPWDTALRPSSYLLVAELGAMGALPRLPLQPTQPWQAGLWEAVRTAAANGPAQRF